MSVADAKSSTLKSSAGTQPLSIWKVIDPAYKASHPPPDSPPEVFDMPETMKSTVKPITRYFKTTDFIPYEGAASTKCRSVTETVGSHRSPVGGLTVAPVMLGSATSAGVGVGVSDGVSVIVGVCVGGFGLSVGSLVGVRVLVGRRVGVLVGVAVSVGVAVLVGVGVWVGVAVNGAAPVKSRQVAVGTGRRSSCSMPSPASSLTMVKRSEWKTSPKLSEP